MMRHFALLFLISSFLGGAFSSLGKIDGSLLNFQDGNQDVIISFSKIPSRAYDVARTQGGSRTSRISKFVATLKTFSASEQSEVISFLVAQGYGHTQLWVSNQLSVKNVPLSILQKIAEFRSVTRIEQDVHYPLEKLGEVVPKSGEVFQDVQWNIQTIEAPAAVNLLDQLTGLSNEVRVAIIDTGIRGTHQAIRDSYLNVSEAWHDPIEGTVDPYDGHGHGTHVMGSILGIGGIGVFPQAKWLSCRGCNQTCPTASLLACGQYLLCPGGNCAIAPHIISNSWNGGQGQTWFDPVIAAWQANGIIPVISNGNNGVGCGSVQSPADSRERVIGVGSTNIQDSISTFSRVGPSVWGDVKPDISAPGENVFSAWATGDSSYVAASGTSMAAPHIAGVIAILKGFKPDLTYDETLNYLAEGAERDGLINTGTTCGGIPETQFPNNAYGHGRVNALQSLLALVRDQGNGTTTTTVQPTVPTSTEEPTPAPIGCIHGQFWFPDEINLPSLICICQTDCGDSYFYTCYTAASP